MPTKKQRDRKHAQKAKGRGLTLAPKKKATKKAKKETPVTPTEDADVPDDAA